MPQGVYGGTTDVAHPPGFVAFPPMYVSTMPMQPHCAMPVCGNNENSKLNKLLDNNNSKTKEGVAVVYARMPCFDRVVLAKCAHVPIASTTMSAAVARAMASSWIARVEMFALMTSAPTAMVVVPPTFRR